MKTGHKNIVIGALLGIVLLMIVGYAAFASNLTINSSAEIDSTWDVHIQNVSLKSKSGTSTNVTTPEGGVSGASYPYVSTDGLTATFYAELMSPGDTMTYTVTVLNNGTLKAKLIGCNWDAATSAVADTGYIRYTKICPSINSIVNPHSTQTFDVTTTYYDNTMGQMQPTTSELEKAATLVLDYVQAE